MKWFELYGNLHRSRRLISIFISALLFTARLTHSTVIVALLHEMLHSDLWVHTAGFQQGVVLLVFAERGKCKIQAQYELRTGLELWGLVTRHRIPAWTLAKEALLSALHLLNTTHNELPSPRLYYWRSYLHRNSHCKYFLIELVYSGIVGVLTPAIHCSSTQHCCPISHYYKYKLRFYSATFFILFKIFTAQNGKLFALPWMTVLGQSNSSDPQGTDRSLCKQWLGWGACMSGYNHLVEWVISFWVWIVFVTGIF